MAINEIEQFEDILSAEVLVDMEKLKDMARSGVPDSVRGVVWRYLLGVESADRSREQTDSRRHIEEYEQLDKENMEISKRVRGDVQRYQRRLAAVNAGYSVNTLTSNKKEPDTPAVTTATTTTTTPATADFTANTTTALLLLVLHRLIVMLVVMIAKINITTTIIIIPSIWSRSGQNNSLAEQLTNFVTRHDLSAVVERILAAYINGNKHVEYSPALVSLCMPFVFVCQAESDMYHCFSRLMSMLDYYLDEQGIRERMANFMTLFRALIPDLYPLIGSTIVIYLLLLFIDKLYLTNYCPNLTYRHNYFIEEEVDVNEWATSWLQFLLSKELPLPCLLRLWDIYFSLDGVLENHVYVCLALLRHYKDALEELEQSEIRTLLLRMPVLDINEVIHQALNIRSEILQRQVSESL
ncbi:rab-GTPase-TBC domain-containing protein [Syncephalis fuscata]|nr:rab-GTPase-TBC domain-containing protein [Syncephalis fuscata]